VGLLIPSRNRWAVGRYDAVESHIRGIVRWTISKGKEECDGQSSY
jgi:hypothetical protein